MIDFLSGKVFSFNEKKIVILTSGGVGYGVFPTGNVLASCKKGENIELHIFTVVRETEISLYGFSNNEEKTLFEKLISVSGIGPKTAKDIVSTPINQFLSAVENGDVSEITKLPGIGKKTAERLIIELSGKLDLRKKSIKNISVAQKEAEEALQNLGYKLADISKILDSAPKNFSTEELVKFFLSNGM